MGKCKNFMLFGSTGIVTEYTEILPKLYALKFLLARCEDIGLLGNGQRTPYKWGNDRSDRNISLNLNVARKLQMVYRGNLVEITCNISRQEEATSDEKDSFQ